MSALAEENWRRLLHRRPADDALSTLYGPLLAAPVAADGCFVLGRIAQSLDGRIATETGASQWISGRADIVHTHRLRALFDAIVVGAGTVRADDPLLTTREVAGPSPVRVVLDPERRLHERYAVFGTAPETLLACADDVGGADRHGSATAMRLPRGPRGLDLKAMLSALAARGLRRVLVEGGGITLSRFLAAGAVDRLHVTVAPLLLGSGVPSLALPIAATPADGLRLQWTLHALGDDLLFDIPLHRTPPPCC